MKTDVRRYTRMEGIIGHWLALDFQSRFVDVKQPAEP